MAAWFAEAEEAGVCDELAVSAYEIWGFTGRATEIIDVLNLWAAFVYAPLLEDRVRPIQDGKGEYGAKVAGQVRRELNRIGGVRPPPEFVLMDRAAIGLGSVFTHLVATGAVAVGDDLVSSVAGGGVLSRVSRRFGEGVVNGALTARVGVAAIEVCRPLPFRAAKRPSVSGLVGRALTGVFGSREG